MFDFWGSGASILTVCVSGTYWMGITSLSGSAPWYSQMGNEMGIGEIADDSGIGFEIKGVYVILPAIIIIYLIFQKYIYYPF